MQEISASERGLGFQKLKAPQDEITSLKRSGKNVSANTSTQIF